MLSTIIPSIFQKLPSFLLNPCQTASVPRIIALRMRALLPLRFLFILSYIFYFCLLNDYIILTNTSPSPAPFPHSKKDYENKLLLESTLEISFYGTIKTSIIGTSVVLLLINALFYVALSVNIINFTTNLSTTPVSEAHLVNLFMTVSCWVHRFITRRKKCQK